MKKLLISLTLTVSYFTTLMLAFTTTSLAQQISWQEIVSKPNFKSVVDSYGNLYTSYRILSTDSLYVNGQPLPNQNINPIGMQFTNFLIRKADKDGNLIWTRNINLESARKTLSLTIYTDDSTIYLNIFSYAYSTDSLIITLKVNATKDTTYRFYYPFIFNKAKSATIALDTNGYLKWTRSYLMDGLPPDYENAFCVKNNTIFDLRYQSKYSIYKLNASNGDSLNKFTGPVSGSINGNDDISSIHFLNNSTNFLIFADIDQNVQPVSKFDFNLNKLKTFEFDEGVTDYFISGSPCLDEENNIYFMARFKDGNIFNGDTTSVLSSYLIKLDSNLNKQWVIKVSSTKGIYPVYPQIVKGVMQIANNKIYLSYNNPDIVRLNLNNELIDSGRCFIAELGFDGKPQKITVLPKNYRYFNFVDDNHSDYLFFEAQFVDSITIGTTKYIAPYGILNGRIGNTSDLNILKGNIYYDVNKNSTKDAGEDDARDIFLTINNRNYFTNSLGNYLASADTETLVVTPTPPMYYTVVPVKDSAVFTSYDSTATINFALQPVNNINDLTIDVVGTGRFRSGRVGAYHITVKNVGTTILSPLVEFQHDSGLSYKSASISPDSNNYPVIKWNIGNLKPAKSKLITVLFDIANPPTLNSGDSILAIGSVYPITGDTTPLNNIDSVYKVINSSFDPNIKETSKPEVINVDDVNGSFAINYTIHFQNTGNDTAFHVYLIDSLDADLKVQSIEVLSASHDYEMSINENNALRWDYYNILLVDSTTNEPMSHGFIKYRVWTKDNPGLGDEFTNFADIYFDINDPVRTNTTSNRIDKVESVTLVKGTTVIVYPNPSNGIFTITADIKPGTTTKLEVIDLTGKLIYTDNATVGTNGLETKIDINTLPQGIYFIKVYAGNEVYTAKVIKK